MADQNAMNSLQRNCMPAFVVLAVAAAAQVPPVTLTTPASPQKVPGADGFIQRWMLLEPIGVTGLTESAVQAAVRKEYFPDQFNVIPHDGDKVTVGDAQLAWHAVDTQEMHGVRLAIGSNAASVWWVNDKEVIGIYGDRQTVIDDGISRRLTLNEGPNIVRAAVINGGGATDFCARFLDSEDRPLKGFTVSVAGGAK